MRSFVLLALFLFLFISSVISEENTDGDNTGDTKAGDENAGEGSGGGGGRGQGGRQQNSNRDKYDVLKEEWCGDYDCYDLLGADQSSEFREIKQKYNNLSLALHPDKNPNQSTEDA
eukprot:72190_1